MKKRVLVMILLSFVIFSITAGYKSEMTRYFDLQAGYESAWSLNVEPIPAQSLSYVAGMPGREIAKWSVLSNQDFRIHIYGSEWNGKMYPVITDENGGMIKNPDYTGDGLDYILTFTYRLGYVADGVEQTADGEFQYKTSEGGGENYFSIVSKHTTGEGENAFIGSVDGSIFFCFDVASANQIKNSGDALPSGDYMAYLMIELESRQ